MGRPLQTDIEDGFYHAGIGVWPSSQRVCLLSAVPFCWESKIQRTQPK